MTAARFLIGDVVAVLDTLPDESIDLALTSPPFFALRSYLDADDPMKPFEKGGEASPGEFTDGLLDVVEAIRPKLAPHGSIAFELGDTYGGSGGAGGDYSAGGLRDGQQAFTGSAARRKRPEPRSIAPKYDRTPNPDFDGGPLRDRAADEAAGILPSRLRTRRHLEGFPLDKSLCLIPELFRFALSYGFNPLTGREIEPWRVRNVVRWCRPNPPVGALGDKFRPATSDMVIATLARDRYFDLEPVRTPLKEPDRVFASKLIDHNPTHGQPSDRPFEQNPGGAPPLDWWEVATEAYEGSHYATWPRKLLIRPILAMSPERVCTTCGEPARRIIEKETSGVGFTRDRGTPRARSASASDPLHDGVPSVTVGWSDCGHDTWRRGLVLDPFAGSGTTLAVATGHGRDAIGIDLDHRNAELAIERIGPMFVTVEDLRPSSEATA